MKRRVAARAVPSGNAIPMFAKNYPYLRGRSPFCIFFLYAGILKTIIRIGKTISILVETIPILVARMLLGGLRAG